MPSPTTFDTWREAARRRLPQAAFDFVDGGAEDEVTLMRNRAAFDDLSLVPRLLRGIESASAATSVLGQEVAVPVLLAPTGDSRISGPEADLAQARGAQAAGTISILSGVASVGPEELVTAADPQWYQIFLFRDRDRTLSTLRRIKALGFSTLVVTVDGPVKGNRERDIRNGFQLPLKPTRAMLRDVRRSRWMWNYFTGGAPGATTQPSLSERYGKLQALREEPPLSVPAVFDADQDWDDLYWLRSVWDGPLLIKGVMCAEDAQIAIDAGCEGVIVSNHGGRELDHVPATIEMLPEIVAAVGGRGEVLIDGGFRRGTDVVKALSLGASACLVARPWLFAMATDGEQGVTDMLEQFRTEIVRTMQLVGAKAVDELGPDLLRRRPRSGWERL